MALLYKDLVKPPQVTRYTNPTPPAPTAPTAAPPAPTPSIPPAMAESIRRAGTPASPTPALQTLDEFSAARGGSIDENAIREQTRKNMQTQIDAVNSYYSDLVRQENQAGEARLDKVRAINVNSGLSGSNFATSQDLQQRDKNTTAVRAIENERNLQIQGVLGKIDEIARNEIAAKNAEAKGNAEAYSTYLSEAKAEAQGQLQMLAGSGIDINQLDEKRKAYLFKAAGLDPQLGELVYESMKPKAAKIDYKAEKAADGQILLYGIDPATGQLKTQRIDFDVPEGYEPTYVDGAMYLKNSTTGDLIPAPMDQSLFTPDYKNYLLSKKEGYAGDFNSWQTEDANRKRSVSTTINSAGLTPYQQYQATSDIQKSLQRNTDGAREVSRQYDIMKSTYQRLDSGEAKDLNATTQAIISTFNKIIDPTSVVRESEYARSPEGQSLLQTLQGKMAALTQGGPGLTKQSLKEFVDLAETFANAAAKSIEAQNARAIATAQAFGLNTDLIGTPGGSQPEDTTNPLGLTPP